MGECPILFSAPMVRAILDGTKTQTRRVVKTIDSPAGVRLVRIPRRGGCIKLTDAGLVWNPYGGCPDQPWPDAGEACPYGGSGDRLWVRESFRYQLYSVERHYNDLSGGSYTESEWAYLDSPDDGDVVWYMADGEPEHRPVGDKWSAGKPSIHMPRWASRIDLEVTGVRVERLQEITDEDAIAEGIPAPDPCSHQAMLPGYGCSDCMNTGIDGPPPRHEFEQLWNEINAKRGYSWDSNPWVWVVEFKRVRP